MHCIITKQAYLHKGLNFWPLVYLCFPHPLMDFSWISVNTCHQCMTILLIWCTIIEVPYYNCFLSSIAATEDQHNFACFHNLPHFEAETNSCSMKNNYSPVTKIQSSKPFCSAKAHLHNRLYNYTFYTLKYVWDMFNHWTNKTKRTRLRHSFSQYM